MFIREYGVKIGQEHGENGRRDIEGRSEDNANVSDAHLVDIRIIDDPDQKCGECSNENPVCLGKLSHQNLVCRDFPGFVLEIR